MKVELINENKVKITLTLDELRKRKISLDDIEKDSNRLMDLIDELDLDEDFSIDDASSFIIETTVDINNVLTVTITKISDFSDLSKFSLFNNKTNKKSKAKLPNNITYKVDSNVYHFDTLDTILDMCNNTKQEKLFFGKNSLYKYNNSYFVIFNSRSTKNKKFLKTFVVLSEYSKEYFSLETLSTLIKERSKLVIENNALQTLSKL